MVKTTKSDKSDHKNPAAGFTLIELLAVLFFTVILMEVLFNMYNWHSKLYNYQQALVRVSTATRSSMQSMQAYTSQADQVLASATIGGTIYTSSATITVLQLPAIDSNGNILSGKWDLGVFYQSGSNLYFELQADPASSRTSQKKLLSDSLLSLVFKYNNVSFNQVSEVSVNLQNQLQIKGQTVQSGSQQNMYLLNE